MSVAAVLFATVGAADATPAAALRCDQSTLVGRLLEQLGALSIDRAAVITRPEWEGELRDALADSDAIADSTVRVDVHTSKDVGEDLGMLAEIIERSNESVVIGSAEILTHKEALANLLADPRVVSGILAGDRMAGPCTARTRSRRGRVVSAESPYHWVREPNGRFLGMMRIDVSAREMLVATARRMGELAVLEFGSSSDDSPSEDASRVVLGAEATQQSASGVSAAGADPLAVLLVGMVRAGIRLTNSYVGGLYWQRPLSQSAVVAAEREMAAYDEDRTFLDAAVKGGDGFFTTFFVSPYSKFVARWFARRGWTPNAVTSLSMAMGIATAVLFATGTRWGLIAGAVTLQVAFTLDCVDGQLSRYTRQFSRFGAWLDSVFDRGKEYLAYAGLAVGSVVGFDADVWVLAVGVLALQTVRHTVDFSFPSVPLTTPEPPSLSFEEPWDGPNDDSAVAPLTPGRRSDEEPAPADGANGSATSPRAKAGFGYLAVRLSRWLGHRSWTFWLKKIVVLPIGERFALISLTAAVFSPRVTFLALLVWGGLALLYQLTGRVMRSLT